MFAAVFLDPARPRLSNHLVGFKPKEQPKVVTREHGLSDATRERMAATRRAGAASGAGAEAPSLAGHRHGVAARLHH